MTGHTVDPGLQPERTALAWRRTGLALAAGALVAARVLPQAGGSAWWLLPGLAGLLTAGVVLVAADRRYRRITRRSSITPPAGAAALATSTAAFLVGATALAYVLIH